MLLFLLTRWRFLYYIPVLGIIYVLGEYPCKCDQITITRANDSLDVFSSTQTNCSTFCWAKKSLILRSTSSSCVFKCVSTSSTFVFKGGLTNSACRDNIDVRSTIGQCQLLLNGNAIDSPVPVFDLSVPGTRLLTGPVNGSFTCKVFQEEILVNGTWFARGGGNLTFRTEKNLLKWSSTSSSPYAGRIVRLQLQCDVSKLCIIIKIQGHISYNIQTSVSPTSIVIRPSPTTSYVRSAHPTISSGRHTRSKTKKSYLCAIHISNGLQYAMTSEDMAAMLLVITITSNTRSGLFRTTNMAAIMLCVNKELASYTTGYCHQQNIIPLESATISPTLATVVVVTSSAAVIPYGGTKAVQDGCERGAWVFCQRFYLAIAAVGTAVLFVLVIILMSCACIRRRRRNLRHEKAVFFQSGLTTLKEADSNTEIALIEDIKPANEGHEGQHSEEAYYQNVPRREKPDKNQSYRPLRLSDGRESPSTPGSPGRFSYSSSTNEVILYDDTSDSNQLIKPSQPSTPAGKRLKTFCLSPAFAQPKNEFPCQTVLDTEEEITYEIMESKTLPPSGRRRDDVEGVSGVENQVFVEDDHRQSHYEVVADEKSNYENLERDYEEDQPNYEMMEEHRNGVENYTVIGDEEQENYETMDTFSGKEQSDYEIMPGQDEKPVEQQSSALLYEKMEAHNKSREANDNGKEKMENQRECDIPVITEDEHDLLYDIPELSLEVQQETDAVPDYHYAGGNTGDCNTGTRLAVPGEVKHDDVFGDDGADYVYANVPDIQANNLREKLRSSWHSGGQRREGANRGNKTVAEKPPEKRPSSWNTRNAGKKNEKTAHEEDDEELYSLPEDFPKPLPSNLLKGRSSPQIKRAEAKNQASPKQKASVKSDSTAPQPNEEMKPRDEAPNRTHLGNPKTNKAGANSSVPASNKTKEQPENSSAVKPSSAGREMKERKDRLRDSEREGKIPSKKNNPTATNKLNKSVGDASSPSKPRSVSKEIQERRWQPNSGKRQASVEPQRPDIEKERKQPQGLINEQPLYTNLVEMENGRQELAYENTDMQTDQQPLYENIGTMGSHVG